MLLAPSYLRELLGKAFAHIDVPAEHAVVLEGSIAEGFGNDASDIDYLVITPGDRIQPTMPTILFIDGRRVEVRMRSAEQIRAQLDTLRTTAARDVGRVSDDLLNRCQRFVNCYPLVNEPFIERLREPLPPAELQDITARWFEHQTRPAYGFAAAMRLLGEPRYAELAERTALARAAKSWLSRQGETYLDFKWLSPQFARAPGGAEVAAEYGELIAGTPSPQAVGGFLTRLGLGADARLDRLELRRRRGVTTWQLGSRVHVVRGRAEIFALSDRAARVWRSLPFGVPLERALAQGPGVTGPLIAFFHRLGLVELRWRGGPVLPGCGSHTPTPATVLPLLALDGLLLVDGDRGTDVTGDVALAPTPARRFAACGMALIWGNLGVENAREDLVGAIGLDQEGTATAASLRMVRSACQSVIAAYGVDPQPPIEEAPLVVARMPHVDPAVAARAVELSAFLLRHGFGALPGGIGELDEFTLLVRRATRCEFPSTFVSAEGWGSTLDIGYDWVRLGAYLDSAFPVEEARDLLASGGAQPATRAEGAPAAAGSAR